MKTKTREELRELCQRSTQVVAWYPHPVDGTVRGPFGRWFQCSGGDNGMGDPIKYPTPVASIDNDVEYAAAAMNNLPFILDELDEANRKIADLELELVLLGRIKG